MSVSVDVLEVNSKVKPEKAVTACIRSVLKILMFFKLFTVQCSFVKCFGQKDVSNTTKCPTSLYGVGALSASHVVCLQSLCPLAAPTF